MLRTTGPPVRPRRRTMTPTDDFTEEEHRQINRRIDKMVATDLVCASSVAILIERGPQVSILGSGTLFRIADESFVITAAHVMKDSDGARLRLAPNGCGLDKIIP